MHRFKQGARKWFTGAIILTGALALAGCAPTAGSRAFWDGFWQGYTGTPSTGTYSSPYTYGTVESVITSDFQRLAHGEVFVLANGQVWEQTEYYTWYWYAFRPRVIIYSSYGSYKMTVAGIDHAVTVRRLR